MLNFLPIDRFLLSLCQGDTGQPGNSGRDGRTVSDLIPTTVVVSDLTFHPVLLWINSRLFIYNVLLFPRVCAVQEEGLATLENQDEQWALEMISINQERWAKFIRSLFTAGLLLWQKSKELGSCKQGFEYVHKKEVNIFDVKLYLSLHCSHFNIPLCYVFPGQRRS